MPVKNITTLEEFNKVIKGNKYVFIDWYAKWCGPCRGISPFIDRCADNLLLKHVVFVKIDVDECEFESNIESLPTFQLFVEGVKKKEVNGANTEAILDMFEKYV